MKILLIGGNGYIGSRLYKQLKNKQYSVDNLDLCWYGKIYDETIVKNYDDLTKQELEKYTPQEPSHSNIKQPSSIRLNYKINRYIHPDSGMTFFSKEEKVVFARFDKNQCRLLKLTDDDIVLCKMYSFRVDPNKWDIQNIQNIENNGDNEIQE